MGIIIIQRQARQRNEAGEEVVDLGEAEDAGHDAEDPRMLHNNPSTRKET
jgi:hypothetical protein